MKEELLHFIWQFRYYNAHELATESGEPLFIHHPGDPNTDQGPDFSHARITIADTLRMGPVELHVRTSDWNRHAHTGDPHYQPVILHVVWHHDMAEPPGAVPVLVLSNRTSKTLLSRYRQFMSGRMFVPCGRLLAATLSFPGAASLPLVAATTPSIPAPSPVIPSRAAAIPPPASAIPSRAAAIPSPASAIPPPAPAIPTAAPAIPSPLTAWPSFRNRLLLQRLDERAAFIRTLLDERRPHWEETLYWLIARSLGQPLNAAAFLAIGRSIPLHFLLRRRTDPARLEALLLDQAAHLSQPLSVHRMRPAHWPKNRLHQLAGLLSNHTGWFTLLLETADPAAIIRTLDAKGLGTRTKHSILLNAHIPLLYAYGRWRQEPRQWEKALHWLDQLPAENNHIIRHWRLLGMTARTAADTQALLELKKNYCPEKKCLDCAIGQSLLGGPP